MDWSNGFADRIRVDEPLGERTWFALGGRARYTFSPASIDELREVLRLAREGGITVRIMGGGANLLVRDCGFDGLVILLDQPAFTCVRYDGERVTAGAGVDLMKLARDTAHRGLSGLEAMAGIPGTVGGAVTMNAGGRFGQFGDVVETVHLLNREGALEQVPGSRMGFGYRCSAVGDRIVVGVRLQLARGNAAAVKRRFHEIWQFKKSSQPLAAHSAGCIFKNPPGESAGRLIDRAGLKGTSCGLARVSEVHGNFIVAEAGARSADVLGLVDRVRETVLARDGVRLELEIDVW